MNQTYIPGFDWIKLLGSMLIALSHMYLYGVAEEYVDTQTIALLGEVVPVFFMISGYLMYQSITTKQKPYRYVFQYLLKYGSVYFILSVFSTAIVYYRIFQDSGIFGLKSFLVDICTLPFHQPFMTQLWFIPPLLIGVLVNTPFWLRKKEKGFAFFLIPYVLLVIIFSVYGKHFAHISTIQAITRWQFFPDVAYFLSRSVRGLLYVYIGMWVAKHKTLCQKLKLRYGILLALAVTMVEWSLIYRFGSQHLSDLNFTISVCIWSSVLFLAILRLKGQCLKKHHAFIAIFSGIMYFFHILELQYLSRWISNGLLLFVVITTLNAILSYMLLQIGRRGHTEAEHGL